MKKFNDLLNMRTEDIWALGTFLDFCFTKQAWPTREVQIEI
jgi:hypothetical protein